MKGKVKFLFLSLFLSVLLAACAPPVYYCEVEFRVDVQSENGNVAWPTLCYPQDQYAGRELTPGGNPAY